MKNLTLIFNDVEEVHLGKDVFLTPYYIAKEFGLNLDIVFPNTETNKNLPSSYRGVNFIRENFLYNKKRFEILREINFFKYILFNYKKIDNLMLFHLSLKTMLQTILYKCLNLDGKVYVKLDLDINSLKSIQSFSINSLKRKIFLKIVKLFFKKIDLVSCETQEIYDIIKIQGLYGVKIDDKLEYIPNGFDEELLNTLKLDLKLFQEKENIMITVGRIGSYQKNNEMLLDALDGLDLKNWKVLLIGPFTSEFEIKYNNFIKNNNEKKENVILIGNISEKKELFEYYNKSKIFLLTSRFESSGLVLIEALRFGNYIVTTDVGASRDVTLDSKIGKVIPIEEVLFLKEEIRRIINNEIDLKEKYLKSLKISKQNFLWSEIIKNSKKMEEIFSELKVDSNIKQK